MILVYAYNVCFSFSRSMRFGVRVSAFHCKLAVAYVIEHIVLGEWTTSRIKKYVRFQSLEYILWYFTTEVLDLIFSTKKSEWNGITGYDLISLRRCVNQKTVSWHFFRCYDSWQVKPLYIARCESGYPGLFVMQVDIPFSAMHVTDCQQLDQMLMFWTAMNSWPTRWSR